MGDQVASRTVGFAIAEEDEARLARLVERYGGGNRSAFLRAAIAQMEALDRAERLRELQAYGAHRAASRGTDLSEINAIVDRVLGREQHPME
jgi:Arc/MetJ-type ribon-helix-helix transcriptional regulator